MRVLTLALHPSIDRVVRLGTLKPGATLDAHLLMTVPAGKGANTARALSCVWPKPRQIVSVGWIGEAEKEWYAARLAELNGIRAALCARPGFTRFAYTLLEASGRETHIKERMPPPARADEDRFLRFWRSTVRPGDIVALCGSAPAGTSKRLLREVFAVASENRASVCVADSNGPALAVAGAAELDGLKGNAAEIGAWLGLGQAFVAGKRAHRAALQKAFARHGAPRAVLITLGAGGAVIAAPGKMFRAAPPALPLPLPPPASADHSPQSTQRAQRTEKSPVNENGDSSVTSVVSVSSVVNSPRWGGGRVAPQSATGCGDAATAGWLWGILQGCPLEEALCCAVACGTAKLASADPGSLDPRYVARLIEKMKVVAVQSKIKNRKSPTFACRARNPV